MRKSYDAAFGVKMENDFLRSAPRVVREGVMMVEPNHPGRSVVEQCRGLDISRSSYYYERRADRAESDLDCARCTRGHV